MAEPKGVLVYDEQDEEVEHIMVNHASSPFADPATVETFRKLGLLDEEIASPMTQRGENEGGDKTTRSRRQGQLKQDIIRFTV